MSVALEQAVAVRTSARLALPVLTNSRLKAARSCLRYHKLRYLDGYRPAKEPDEARFGTLWHVGLEAWWKSPAADERLDRAVEALRGAGESDAFDLAKAEVLLAGYDARWGDEPYEVLGVEVEFYGPVRNPATDKESRVWQLGGKLDVLLRDLRDFRKVFMEHKTSSEDVRQGTEYWRRLRMDGQISTYFEGSKALGHDVQACIYDVVKKPAQRQSEVPVVDEEGVKVVVDGTGTRVRTKDGKKWRETADSKLGYAMRTRPEAVDEYRTRIGDAVAGDLPAFFQRGEVVRLESEVREGLLDTWVFAQLLRESIRLGRAPRNPDACVRYGRTCEYFDACTGAASLDDPYRFRREELVHAELAGTAEKREGMEPGGTHA